MIHVPCWCPTTQAWKKWAASAERKIESLVDDFLPAKRAANPSNRPNITKYYSALAAKEAILSFFHYKCAYCESRLTMKSCRVEHYRPKGRVLKDLDDSGAVEREVAGSKEQHLGYYWLAYRWGNLLPACMECNEPGDGYGKWDRFPVRGGVYGFEPGEEENEEPLLLNPWWDCPDRHFVFWKDGSISGVTDAGRKCVRMFALDIRESLQTGRRAAYDAVKSHFKAMLLETVEDNEPGIEEHKKQIDAYVEGRRPYSAAGRAALYDSLRNIENSRAFNVVLDYWPRGGEPCLCRSWEPSPPPGGGVSP